MHNFHQLFCAATEYACGYRSRRNRYMHPESWREFVALVVPDISLVMESPAWNDAGDDDTDGDTDGSETDGEETDGEDTDDTGKIEDANGIAMLHGEIPPIDDGEGGSDTSGSGGDSGIPDDAVLVVLDGTGAATCKAPWNGPDCGGNWRISFTLLPEMQQPGTYDLFDEAMGSFSFADAPHPEGDCPWGGGSLGGTLVIESVDDEVVIGHIEDADAFDFDANVAFVAPRC